MRFRVVGVMDGDECPAEDFLLSGEASTRASRIGLIQMIQYVATDGLQGTPAGWWHEASKADGVYEFRKGDLRLFFFKGVGGEIAVCTCGVVKKGSKADKAAVSKAARLRQEYMAAIQNNSYEVIHEA